MDPVAEMKVRPGLSSYAGDPGRAAESVAELVEFARGKVPGEAQAGTEVRLMATAGLRMLEDDAAREKILEGCRKVLRGSGFRFRDEWAAVISGRDEGIFAWVAANYALGTLGGDPLETTGIIELGGASAQVTFASSEPMPPEFLRVLNFGENTYSLYSNSFLHFGQNAAYHSVQELLSSRVLKSSTESSQKNIFIDPCSPKGYSHAEANFSSGNLNLKVEKVPVAHADGNFSECRSAAVMMLQEEKDKCQYQQCHLGSNFIPKLQGRFLATENFFYTSKFFKLGPTPILSDFMLVGKYFCGEDFLTLKEKYQTLKAEDFSRYCFSSAYIVALLHDSLGIALDDNRLQYANQVGSTELEWALGAFIMHSISNLNTNHAYEITSLVRSNIASILSPFVVFVLLAFAVWIVLRWRKPQLKTIYDLEKGRYIVTRVNR